MKIRLLLMIATLLLLPAAALYLSGASWAILQTRALNGDATLINPPSTLLTTLMMFGYIIFVNHLNKLITGQQPFKQPFTQLKTLAAASALLCWLLAYLNLYTASWATQPGNPLLQALLYTPLFALLAPAVLCTHAFIAALPGVLTALRGRRDDTPPAAVKLSRPLLPVAAAGLIGGALWPDHLDLLLWLAPLLMLIAWQQLQRQATLFSGLARGNYGRLICAGLAGLVAGNFALFAYHSNGGIVLLDPALLRQFGLLLFGLACVQLHDILPSASHPIDQP